MEKYITKITIITDYKPTFLDGIKSEMSHHFDVPISNVRIKCEQDIDFNEVFKLLDSIRDKKE